MPTTTARFSEPDPAQYVGLLETLDSKDGAGVLSRRSQLLPRMRSRIEGQPHRGIKQLQVPHGPHGKTVLGNPGLERIVIVVILVSHVGSDD